MPCDAQDVHYARRILPTMALMLPHRHEGNPAENAVNARRHWRDLMTKRQYGVIATVAGAAMAAAWWWRRHDWVAEGMSEAGHARGELIYSNSPTASER